MTYQCLYAIISLCLGVPGKSAPIFRGEGCGMLTEFSNKVKVVGAKQVKRAVEEGRLW